MKPYFKAWNIKEDCWEEVTYISWKGKRIFEITTKREVEMDPECMASQSWSMILYSNNNPNAHYPLDAIELHLHVKP